MSFKDVVSEAARTAKESAENEYKVDHIKDMGDGKSMSEFIKEHVQNKEHDESTKTIADKAKGIAQRKIDEIKHDKELAETPAEETIKNRIDEARTRQRENGGFSINGRPIHGGPEGAKGIVSTPYLTPEGARDIEGIVPNAGTHYEGLTTAEIAHAEQNRMYQESRLPNSPDKNGEEQIRQLDLSDIYGVDSIGKGGLNDPMPAGVKFDDALTWSDAPTDAMQSAMIGYGSMSCNILNAHDSSLKEGETWEFIDEEKGFAVFKNGIQTDKTLGLMPNDIRMYCEKIGSPMTNNDAIKLHNTQINLYSAAVDSYVTDKKGLMRDMFLNTGMKALTRDGLVDSGFDSQSEINFGAFKVDNQHGIDMTEHLSFVKSSSMDVAVINGVRDGKSTEKIFQEVKDDVKGKIGNIFNGASKDASEEISTENMSPFERNSIVGRIVERQEKTEDVIKEGLANGTKQVGAELEALVNKVKEHAEEKEADDTFFGSKFGV